jgi:hypothetical protein
MDDDLRLTMLENRVTDLEKRVGVLDIQSAVIANELVSIKGDTSETKDIVRWVSRLLFGSIILAMVAFVLGGGLTLV